MTSLAKPIGEYPSHGLMPKQDTQVANFLKKFPNYDGRNTVIAILDTGVDPGAAGMQVTTDGKPKIIDIVDCTGGGDVATSTIVKPNKKEINGEQVSVIEGLGGRTLIVDPSWKNPSGEYRVGLKRAYELFPSELVERLKSERRQNFEIKQSHLVSEAQAQLAEFNKKNPNVTDEKSIQQRNDLEARIDQLKALIKNYEDPGILLDCVVFFDGQDWRAVIDVKESGDLRGQPAMADYRKELEYHTFGEEDLLNFSVNIYEDGDILSIVTLSGSHGSHVAGIAAANFPDDPTLNGVAPGAQIVSLRIGDARLDSMETGPGLTRAAAHLAINNVDLANMSFGESSSSPVDGHFIKLLAEEAVGKSGCIFVTSAGNDGPCFSSIGAPAGMHASFITVGAYVKHAQMQAEYALLESVAERPYTWSSRGPSTDGYHGVDIYAPGSAITSVPVYGLNKLDLKNGTSMSSPNACGCVAVLVSALKAEKIDYTPYRLKNAIIQTGKSVDDPLGVGFIQVDKAWEYLESYKEHKDLDILFETVVNKRGHQRGIYLRELDETSQVQYITTQIHPTFMGEKDPENPQYNRAKFDFDARVALIATQSWITTPDFLYIHSGGNGFQIKVDPTALSESEFHYGEVLGYDTAHPDRGPLFRVPVSVVKPTQTKNGSLTFQKVEYGPGDIIRRFVHVPEGATDCELTIRAKAPSGTSPARFMLHLLQLVPKKSQKHKQTYSFLLGAGSFGDPKSEDQVIVKRFAVRGGLNLEVALAQFWSGLGKHAVELNLEFHGVQLAGNLAIGNGVVKLDHQITRLDIAAPIRREDPVDVKVSFDVLRKYSRPTEAVIAPLHSDRNSLRNTKTLYGLVLTYNFKTEANTSVTPYFPTVMDQLYEHYLAGVFGIVYDANHKVMGYLDVYRHKITLQTKGDYKVQLQLLSETYSILEKLKTTVCELDFPASKTVTFNPYQTISDVFTADKPNPSKVLERNDQKALFIAAPLEDASWLPSTAKPGDALVGTLSFQSKTVNGGKYKALYVIPPSPAESKSTSSNGKKSDDVITEELTASIKNLQVGALKKLDKKSTAYDTLLKHLESENENDITLLEYKMDDVWTRNEGNQTDALTGKSEFTKAQVDDIVALSEKIQSQINETELLQFYMRPSNGEVDEAKKQVRKTNDKKKQQLVKALKHRVAALSALLPSEQVDHQELQKQVDHLAMWTKEEDTKSDLVSLLSQVKRERHAGRPGLALKAIEKYLDATALISDNVKDIQTVWTVRADIYAKDLKWTIWADYDAKWKHIRSPPGGAAPF
ncbi:uncharacterized protein BX664DRAFT_362744 [Halteromyces radiatus]|uniref:uncharacterized protein n=1 Tax=Halteromyces radiatus TaxID=101107 RepID=UPI0022208F2B|nr:uncharacterized protein BX664DRAFT_362744 [Halteromyces radiatus]KAI8076819.1 hypothetical protein BX664DRAFT_362744 [Halteromyces radiatus]